MDSKTMKWMEQLTCKDTAKQIDEMVIEDYAKEWKNRMVKCNILWLIRQIYDLKHRKMYMITRYLDLSYDCKRGFFFTFNKLFEPSYIKILQIWIIIIM